MTAERQQVLGRRRSPLQRHADELASGSGTAVSLREVPFLGQIGLRAEPATTSAQALAGRLGTSLPLRVGDVSHSDGGDVLWLGPDEFLLVVPDEATGGPDPAALAADLAGVLEGMPGQVVDLSANRTTLELSGPKAQEVLDKSCQLDLDEVAFPVGTALVTLLGNIGMIVWRTEVQTWRLMPRSSFAVYVARWLLDGMREYA